jgi:hypothetical protein
MSPPTPPRWRIWLFHTMAGCLALRLFLPAAILGFSPQAADAFRQTGLPEWVRAALAWPEMIGTVLFLVPATFCWGAGLLTVDLCGAITVHWILHEQPGALYWLLGAVILLAVVRRRMLAIRMA